MITLSRRPSAVGLASNRVIHLDSHSADRSLQARFPHADAGYKKFNSRPVAPTILRNEPFGEYVDGAFSLRGREFQIGERFQMALHNGGNHKEK